MLSDTIGKMQRALDHNQPVTVRLKNGQVYNQVRVTSNNMQAVQGGAVTFQISGILSDGRKVGFRLDDVEDILF